MEIFTKICYCCKITVLLQKFRLSNNRMKLIHKSYKFRIYPTNEKEFPERDNINNLMSSCPSCNIQKNSYSLENFRSNIKKILVIL